MQTSSGLPVWLQAIVALVGILLAVGSALAWFLVMWPAIRNQERRAREMEAWLKSPEVREIFSAAQTAFLRKFDLIDGVRSAVKMTREIFTGKKDKEQESL